MKLLRVTLLVPIIFVVRRFLEYLCTPALSAKSSGTWRHVIYTDVSTLILVAGFYLTSAHCYRTRG